MHCIPIELIVKYLFTILLFLQNACFSDTVGHYIDISDKIPQMEMKANQQSQSWARSARTVITLTCDNLIDSLTLTNKLAKKNGQPLYCLPVGKALSTEQLDAIIKTAYRNNASEPDQKNQLTVSEVALMGLQQEYPCNQERQMG